MHFKLVYENHGNFGLHVGDYFIYLKYALESVGHRADIEYAFAPGYMNIMLECFNDMVTEKIESSWTAGTGLIVIATEFLTGMTFNDIYLEDNASRLQSDHNQRHDVWQMRYNNFVSLLPRMTAVWHVAEQQQIVYQEAFPTTLVDYMPHGYIEQFATVKNRTDLHKDIDVLFTGTMTSYRKNILQSLSDAGLQVMSSILFTAPFHREDLVARSKLVLNIKQHPDWKHESVTRLYYHISNDSLLMTDRCRHQSDLFPYVIERKGEWVAAVKQVLNKGDFTDRAKAARERFSKERPVLKLIAPLLHRAGIT